MQRLKTFLERTITLSVAPFIGPKRQPNAWRSSSSPVRSQTSIKPNLRKKSGPSWRDDLALLWIRLSAARWMTCPWQRMVSCAEASLLIVSDGERSLRQHSDHVAFFPSAKGQQATVLEQKLTQIWREVLDLHGDVDRQANFFDLGGDSLRSLVLIYIHRGTVWSADFRRSFFRLADFRRPTAVSGKGGALSALGLEPSHLTVPWPLPDDMRNKLLVHFESWEGSRPTRDRLVAGLNPAGSKFPLFWVFQEASEFSKVARVLSPIRRSMRSARASALSRTKRTKYRRLRCAMFRDRRGVSRRAGFCRRHVPRRHYRAGDGAASPSA